MTKKSTYSFDPNYISTLTLGYNTEKATTFKCLDGHDVNDKCRIDLTRTSVKNNYFNLKVNIASSENVNNALLAKRFDDYKLYSTLAEARYAAMTIDGKPSKVKPKTIMEFVPAVLFVRENSETESHTEFQDTEWHFYAIGNIGDSKKTDYTRAYDPNDMNEFVLEFSDNTKNNSTFQSGVYLDSEGRRVIESIEDTQPHAYIYPITPTEWNSSNKRYHTLYTEEFDGDNSFEPRYACCGDYRDGKFIDATDPKPDPNDAEAIANKRSKDKDKIQLAKNEEVWRAFYRWVITATDEEFVNEFEEWCVKDGMLFFYVYTLTWTMMDNRAKNTFWHFAKTGTHRRVSKPVIELLHLYEEYNAETDTYTTTKDTNINTGKAYYTQYAFDIWDYDNDTGLGINNNGELIFPYGKEDTDYRIDGQSSSGHVFNGATSTFWCRIRDLMDGDVNSIFNRTNSNCWRDEHLINEFDNFQNSYPEEVWRLDINRKYIRPYIGTSVDGSIPKPDRSYLRDMMQGRKKYHRRQWVRDQSFYYCTKFLNPIITQKNFIMFRCNTPKDAQGNVSAVVTPNYDLVMTPYSDMYIHIAYGNGGNRVVRAKGGVEVHFDSPVDSADDLQVLIYGASRIQALSDISACYIRANSFAAATKLRKLVIGNSTEGYNNPFLVTLNMGDNELLEELDIRNCAQLTGSLDLSKCSNMLRLYADGSSLTSVIFAVNGKIRTAILPDSISTLYMRNLNNLETFTCGMNRLNILTLEGGTLDSRNIVENTIDTLDNLTLYNINWVLPETTLLNSILNLFHSQITGNIHISGSIRNQEIANYASKWNDLTVTYEEQNLVPQHLVRFVNADDDETVLYEMYVDRNSKPVDPYELGLIERPTKSSTAQYDFTFGLYEPDGTYISKSGWDSSMMEASVLSDRTIKAVYQPTTRTYTVTWQRKAGDVIKTVRAPYGSEVVYDGEMPVLTDGEVYSRYQLFKGWDNSSGYIRGDTVITALWDEGNLPDTHASELKELKDMSFAEIYAVAKSGNASTFFEDKDYFEFNLGHDFNFANVESRELVSEPLVLDGQTAVDTGIKLFSGNSPSFTLAIDFQFASTETDNTLVSCYNEDGHKGFRLRYNTSPNILWGDKNVMVGNYSTSLGHFRDMVVIRHQAGSNTLFVYSGYSSSAERFNPDILCNEIVRVQDAEHDLNLILGAITFPRGGYDYYGKGVIHWAKLWLDDLGNENALQLAQWCHEPMRMEYWGTGRYRLSGGSAQRSNASFIANCSLHGRGYWMNSTNTNAGGWRDSAMRKFVTGRLHDALPIPVQAMLQTVKIGSTAGNQSREIYLTDDKTYLMCYKEVHPTLNDAAYNGEAGSDAGVPWFVGNSYQNTVGGSMTADATRVKFRGRIIPEDATYYFSQTDPTLVSTNNVKVGDVWINKNNSNIGYIYIDEKEIEDYAIPIASAYKTAHGGWFSAGDWWGRSPSVNNSTSFLIVYNYGSPYGYYAYSVTSVVLGFSI